MTNTSKLPTTILLSLPACVAAGDDALSIVDTDELDSTEQAISALQLFQIMAHEGDALSPDDVGQATGEIVRERLRDAERDDERQHRGMGGKVKVGREDRALQPDHRADERVHHDEERELSEIRTEAKPNIPTKLGHGTARSLNRLVPPRLSRGCKSTSSSRS